MDSQRRAWEERGLREAILAGEAAAWRQLYDRHFRRLYGRVWRRLQQDTHATEEVVQETWLVAVRRIRSFHPAQGPFEAWLWGIAEKVLRNHQRKQQKRSRRERPLRESAAPSPASAPHTRIALREEVRGCLDQLSPQYREVLEAKYHLGLSVREIAAARSQSPKAVESLLSRARSAFRGVYSEMKGSKDHEE